MYLLFSRKLIEPVSVHDINPDLEGEVTSFPRKISQQSFFFFFFLFFFVFFPSAEGSIEGWAGVRELLYNEFHYTSSYLVPRRNLSSLSNLSFGLGDTYLSYLSVCLLLPYYDLCEG